MTPNSAAAPPAEADGPPFLLGDGDAILLSLLIWPFSSDPLDRQAGVIGLGIGGVGGLSLEDFFDAAAVAGRPLAAQHRGGLAPARSEVHMAELQSLMRNSYTVLSSKK